MLEDKSRSKRAKQKNRYKYPKRKRTSSFSPDEEWCVSSFPVLPQVTAWDPHSPLAAGYSHGPWQPGPWATAAGDASLPGDARRGRMVCPDRSERNKNLRKMANGLANLLFLVPEESSLPTRRQPRRQPHGVAPEPQWAAKLPWPWAALANGRWS